MSQKITNRLKDASSPYLQQHAHNPVDWREWNSDSLSIAKKEDKPIIVSIGYSACHWCHVMEHESFENEAIANIMNEHFICIKVDREERPDVDQVYMDAVQAMGLQGGWPLNVFLTPDQKPFYGGTYFPANGWTKLLTQVANVYQSQRDEIEKSANGFLKTLSTSEVQKYGLKDAESEFNQHVLTLMYDKLKANFDLEKGGMQRAPKFPMPSIYAFLLRENHINKNKEGLKQVMLTLDQMAMGGLYDQVGGGFTRYSTDANWFVPHFEKMLYDNGQLVSLYSEAFAVTKAPLYKEVVYQSINWLQREMTDPAGGFYAALDADSEGVEGKFYVWSQDELVKILGPDAALITEYYNTTTAGNWESNKNIPFKNENDIDFAARHQIELEEFKDLVKICDFKLLQARSNRIRPGLDDKILSGWNGLMLKGLVDAYAVFNEPLFLSMAISNASFLITKMKAGSKLYRNYKNAVPTIDGYLEDYAAVAEGLIALYQITFDEIWLNEAKSLIEYSIESFYDEEEGFFFFTDHNSEALIARKKEIFDNVIPSSNSIMAANLYNLGLLLDNENYRNIASRMVQKVAKLVDTEPKYLTNWASFICNLVQPTAEVVIIGENAEEEALKIHQHFIPNKVVLGMKKKGESNLPLLRERGLFNNETTFYVCQNKTCQLPVNTAEEALKQINSAAFF